MRKMLVLLAAVVICGCGSKEIEIEGQPMSAWMITLEQGDRASASIIIADAARNDPRIVPVLIKAVKGGSFAAAEVLGKIGTTPSPEQNKEVVAALAHEVTTKGVGRNSIRLACARAIPRFGMDSKGGVPALLELLKDEDSVLREQAAKSLGTMPPDAAKEAVGPLLVAARTDQAFAVQQSAVEAVKAIDPAALQIPKDKN